MSISSRVGEAFEGGADREAVTKYLEWLIQAMVKSEERVRRSMIFALLGAFVFELVVVVPKAELTIGPVKLSDATTVLAFLPVFVMYSLLEVVMAVDSYDETRVVFNTLFEKWHPNASGKEIAGLLMPPEPLYLRISGIDYSSFDSKANRIEKKIGFALLMVLLIVAPIMFQIHAYIVLWGRLGIASVALWVSMVVTIALLVSACMYIVASAGGGHEPRTR